MSGELCDATTPTPLAFTPQTPARDIHAPARPRAARLAVATLFFLNGSLFATWVARIPAIQAARGFSHGQLGLALLVVALGAMVAMPLAGRMAARFGSGNVCKFSALLYAALLPTLAVAPGNVVFVAALFLFGAAHGSLDVAMNAHAVDVERRYARPIMASFHALFSTGGLAGAAAGGALASLGLAPFAHFSLVAVLCGTAAWIASPHLLPPTPAAVPSSRAPRVKTPETSWRDSGLLALGIVALCTMMGEGAIADWSGVYLRTVRATPESIAALGYAAFSIAMALGRFFGDGLTARFGPVRLVRAGGSLAALGLLVALVIPGATATLLGLAGVGLGFSAIVPIVFSAAGRTPGLDPGMALAVVTTTGYLGFLVGPPLIGLVAQLVGLQLALGIIVATSLLSVALGRAVAPRETEPVCETEPLRAAA